MVYGKDDTWKNFVVKLKLQPCNYQYKLTLNYSNILIIDTNEQFNLFCQKFGYLKKVMKSFFIVLIDWNKITKKYDGIEINNYNSFVLNSKTRKKLKISDNVYDPWSNYDSVNDGNLRIMVANPKYLEGWTLDGKRDFVLAWHEFLDMDSGCVWNPKAIKTWRKI